MSFFHSFLQRSVLSSGRIFLSSVPCMCICMYSASTHLIRDKRQAHRDCVCMLRSGWNMLCLASGGYTRKMKEICSKHLHINFCDMSKQADRSKNSCSTGIMKYIYLPTYFFNGSYIGWMIAVSMQGLPDLLLVQWCHGVAFSTGCFVLIAVALDSVISWANCIFNRYRWHEFMLMP